jgi:hypothetical protein
MDDGQDGTDRQLDGEIFVYFVQVDPPFEKNIHQFGASQVCLHIGQLTGYTLFFIIHHHHHDHHHHHQKKDIIIFWEGG